MTFNPCRLQTFGNAGQKLLTMKVPEEFPPSLTWNRKIKQLRLITFFLTRTFK